MPLRVFHLIRLFIAVSENLPRPLFLLIAGAEHTLRVFLQQVRFAVPFACTLASCLFFILFESSSWHSQMIHVRIPNIHLICCFHTRLKYLAWLAANMVRLQDNRRREEIGFVLRVVNQVVKVDGVIVFFVFYLCGLGRRQ